MSASAIALRERLQQHFSTIPANEHSSQWDTMWKQKVTPWDREKPNPALIDTLEQKEALLGSPIIENRRKRALVPGCGAGYDVLLFASFGYDAVGIDASITAIETSKALQIEANTSPKRYVVRNEDIGAGSAQYLVGDFFHDDFLEDQQFDVIYDYTFLCALPTELRPAWAKKMSTLLSPNGTLICVEFPLNKSSSAGGPPHGLNEALYIELFKEPGSEVSYGEDGSITTTSQQVSSIGLVRIARWIPQRSHHSGQGMDAVSLWQHFDASQH